MKNHILLALVAILALTGMAYAGPASPDPVDVRQPDGRKLKGRIMGDEFQGWVETEDGYTVVREKDTGWWEWAQSDGKGGIRPSGVKARAGDIPPAGTGKSLKPARDTERERAMREGLGAKRQQRTLSAPTDGSEAGASSSRSVQYGNWDPYTLSGTRKLLVILVKFADRATLQTTADGWDTSFFSTTGGAKSLVNFYKDNSYNALTVEPVPTRQSGKPQGIVEVSIAQNHPNGSTDYLVERAWVGSAVTAASAFVNFSGLDTSHDGNLTTDEASIYLIPAGYEASGTSLTPNVWAHMMYDSVGVYGDGKKIIEWAMNGELNSSSIQHTIGVSIHEVGHLMCGLPDLYDIDGYNAGVGAFSTMASGNWGRTASETYSGTTPSAFDAWSRRYLGWISPRTVGGAGLSFGPALSASNNAFMMQNAPVSTDQYFLVENRYPTGWDEGLERWLGDNYGGGLLIEHIDETIGTPFYGDINASQTYPHQGVVVEQASTAYGSLLTSTSFRGHATTLWYSGNNASFRDDTSPNSKLYDGTSTNLGVWNISTRAQTMTADVGMPPSSAITSPTGGSSLHGPSCTITGTAADTSGTGLQKVEVSTNGGTNWSMATGTTSWSYTWTLPDDASYTLKSRATDNTGAAESPGAGISVIVDNKGAAELQHYYWNPPASTRGCAECHTTVNKFLPSDYRRREGFCASCHNGGGIGHDSMGIDGHPYMVNVSTAWTKKPTYGNVTANEDDNRPKAHLKDGKYIVCVTCHNPMKKYEDYGRSWEYTTTTDFIKYRLDRGRWDWIGKYRPKVYKSTSVVGTPSYSRDKKPYLASPGDYTYNEYSGWIKFNVAQTSNTNVYVDLGYPYLRVGTKDDNLCEDCHTEATHRGANCLACHQAHGTTNLKGVPGTLRTADRSERAVSFQRYTGDNSFADGDATYDGVCEVCHTTTKYHRRDGTGFVNHSGGADRSRTDCTTCHTHGSGFAKY